MNDPAPVIKAVYSAGVRPDTGIPVIGPVRFVCSCSGWKDDRTFENPTQVDALQAADRLIAATGDNHHVFYEGCDRLSGDGSETFVDLQMGS